MPEYTKEQIDEARKTLKKCIEIEGRYETGPYRCKQPTLGGYVYVTKGIYTIPLTKERDVILSALSTAEQNILLHIQDHDDLMQHIAALVDMGNRHGMGNCTEWVELVAADIGYESTMRVIPMLNDALIKANRERDALAARCAELEARLQGAAELKPELLERLAEIEHNRWAEPARKALEEMTEERRERWERLEKIPYTGLSEEMKELDRIEVRRYWRVIAAAILGEKKE